MKPTRGRIVHYRLTDADVSQISAARQAAGTIANSVVSGQYYPAMVVAEWGGDHVNLQVFLDGPDSYWATSRSMGENNGQWVWPVKEPNPYKAEHDTESVGYLAEAPDAATHHPDLATPDHAAHELDDAPASTVE